MKKHPMQPIVVEQGVHRFRRNAVVDLLLMRAMDHGFSLNDLWVAGQVLPREDWYQFYQLIGYSVSGYGDVFSESSDAAHVRAMDRASERLANKGEP